MAARKMKADRITNPDPIGDATHEAIYAAIRPLDRVAHEMETKWGVERLLSLISPETAAKFGSAKAKLDFAIDAADPDMVAKRASTMIRGWQAMDAEATAAGKKPIAEELEVWVGEDDDGNLFSVVRTAPEATHLARTVGGKIYYLEEIIRLLNFFEKKTPVVAEIKKHFPDASLVGVSERNKLNDDIPF